MPQLNAKACKLNFHWQIVTVSMIDNFFAHQKDVSSKSFACPKRGVDRLLVIKAHVFDYFSKLSTIEIYFLCVFVYNFLSPSSLVF